MLIVVAGPAGCGKSTLADLLARTLSAPHCDFDVVGQPLLDEARRRAPGRADADLLVELRPERYRALAEAARSAAETAPNVVVSAPFTRHVADPQLWAAWVSVAQPPDQPGRVLLLWLDLDPRQRWARMAARGEERDRPALARGPEEARAPLPAVPFTRLDAGASLTDLLCAARDALAR